MTTPFTEQAIATMSYPELRKACKKVNLHANGTKQILRQRLLSAVVVADNQPSPKKTTCVKHLLCAITWELPFEPVMTEDGFVYDRNAILTHFKTFPGDNVKSPMTNLTIGRRLVPVPTIQSTIQSLIDDGLVGDKALVEAWNQRIEDKRYVEDMLKMAEGGNVKAMVIMGNCYWNGDHGVLIDLERSLFWHRKGHSAGELESTLTLGSILLLQHEPRDPTQGLVYLRMAADRGCLHAAFVMGAVFGSGGFGIEKDAEKAIFWLEKSLGTSTCGDWDVMCEDIKRDTQNIIADLREEIANK